MKPTILLLAFCAGFIDTASFIGAGGVFTAHVTGNFVLFAAAMVQGLSPEDYLKLWTLPVFFFSAFAIHFFLKKGKLDDQRGLRFLGMIEGILLVAVGASAVFLSVNLSILVCILVVAMAFQNVLQRMYFLSSPTTTVMTGNMTALAMELASYLIPTLKAVDSKAKNIVIIAVAFFVGCALGAFLTSSFGISCVLFPGVVLLFHFIISKTSSHLRV